MYEPMLSIEERERIAYIEGHVEKAALLGQILDGDHELQEQITSLEDDVKSEQRRGDDEYDRAEKAEERAADLEQHLDDAKAEIAELRQEIHDKCLDLV